MNAGTQWVYDNISPENVIHFIKKAILCFAKCTLDVHLGKAIQNKIFIENQWKHKNVFQSTWEYLMCLYFQKKKIK